MKETRLLTAVAAASLLTVTSSFAVTRGWDNGVTGDWDVDANWSADTEPGTDDVARIGSNGNSSAVSATLSGKSTTIQRFIFGQNTTNPAVAATITIGSGGTLNTTVATTSRIGQTSATTLNIGTGGALSMAGGYSSDVNSAFNISGTASVAVNTSSGSSNFGASSAASLDVTGSAATISYGGDLDQGAFGTLSFGLSTTGASTFTVVGDFSVNAASLLTIDGSAYTGGIGDITIVNAGTMTGTFGSGNYSVTGLGVENVNWTLSQNVGSSGDLVLNIIPEPGSYALLAGLTGLMFVMVRRRCA